MLKTGQAAVLQYIEENRDRVVELTPEVIAKTQLLMEEGGGGNPLAAPDVETVDVYGAAVIDRGLPGRLFRGLNACSGTLAFADLWFSIHLFGLWPWLHPFSLGCGSPLSESCLWGDSLPPLAARCCLREITLSQPPLLWIA